LKRKRNPIVLNKLAKDSGELTSMLADLCGKPEIRLDGVKPARWSRRFAASGKTKCAPAPRIRLS
jgi:hypothetical protein